MRRITEIMIHCSATRAGRDYRAADIDKWHRQQGFAEIGYHFVVDLDGTIEVGRGIEKVGAHCRGHNAQSIGICYVGGLDAKGRPADTRTQAQRDALETLVYVLVSTYPIEDICGHRDTSPDANGDGEIAPDEWIKDCPCFNVRDEFSLAICKAKKI